MSDRNRGLKNGLAGLGGALGFLLFVTKLSQKTSAAKKRKKGKTQPVASIGLTDLLKFIFLKTCNARELSTFLGLSTCLLLRTLGSVWVANHWGKVVSAIVTRRFAWLKKLLIQFAAGTVGLAFLNAMLKYYIAMLKENVREKITLWVHEKYMLPNEHIFYKANCVEGNLDGVKGEADYTQLKLDNCDHRIASDIDKFSELFATVLSQSLKPVVDFLVYSVELSRVQGPTTPMTLYAWFAFASAMSTFTLPPFSKLAAIEQALEGKFIGSHSNLIANAEQIAFLGGEKPELSELNNRYKDLRDHKDYSINLSFRSEVFRQYLNKYIVTIIAALLVSRPLYFVHAGFSEAELPASDVSSYLMSTWRNMESMSVAVQDLFELTNRVGRLSGLAQRVKDLMEGVEKRAPILEKEIAKGKSGPFPPKFKKGEILKFEHVSVYKPDGTLLVKDLNFSVNKGDRVLITGPNGCGKSSLFRIIRKLWPLAEGTITMPNENDLYFLTQVNFVPQGTLRDLVTYPLSGSDLRGAQAKDEYVYEVLSWAECSPEVVKNGRAQLEFTVDSKIIRPKLDDVRDWGKDLSPGQKQKIAFARLFFHRPRFVVLDECTNGISPDVEKKIYDKCSELGMSIFSISHKIELKEFHDYELHYHGDAAGTYDFLPCSETRGRYLG